MPKKNQTPVFLAIYVDKEGKETFEPFRVEMTDMEGSPVRMVVANERAKNEDGSSKTKAMNRAARRLLPSHKERMKLIHS